MSTAKPSSSWMAQFKPGERVEVSCNDRGFRGSWYAGTVVRREAKNTNHYLVEYDQLYADESGEKLLQETVDWVQLRPPPPPPEKKVQFKVEDEVEAFYSDGWWEGAIIAEHSGGKFAVFLRGFDEEIVLEEKDLRLPVQWVRGNWEPRLEQVQREKEMWLNSNFSKEVMKFTQGMQVEVLTDEDGLKGAWFAATIIEPSGEDKYLIEYKTLRNDDDTEFLREVIAACNIRPCPPEIIVVDGFKVWDAVDAYYNEGWWVGVIAKVLINSNYEVSFIEYDEKTTFNLADLRPHQEWLNGKWVVP